MIKGGREDGWPTLFPKANSTDLDYARTIEYIGRLVLGKPCGVRDLGSLEEKDLFTRYLDSTIALA